MADDQPVKGQAEVEESWAARAMRLDAEETSSVVIAKVMGAPAGRTIVRSTGARTGR